MKADTRVDGPWTEKDYRQPKELTKQLQVSGILDNMYPWQTELMQRVQDFDMRTIHMVVCKKGGEGKTMFSEMMEYKDLAFEVPPFTSMEDIMQCVMGVPPYKTYLIDMPRAMPKSRLAGFFAGIESLKNGVMYDKRYHFKKRRIDRPNIIVFSNKLPKLQYLSRDRWRLWTITQDKRLVVYKCDHQKPKKNANKNWDEEEDSEVSFGEEAMEETDDEQVLLSELSSSVDEADCSEGGEP